MRIVRISDLHRQRQRSASELDAALERALELRDLRGDFEAELRAADSLVGAFDPVSVPAEALVALRAAIAARKAEASRRRTRRLAWQTAPGAVAAVTLGLLGYVGFSHHTNSGPPGTAHLANAARTLQVISEHISKVQQGVQANDPSLAQSQALSTRAALVQAQQQAVAYAPDDPARDLLLNALELRIQELDALLAKLSLPPVQPLPPVKVAPSGQSGAQPQAAGASSTTQSPGSSTTTSSSSPTSTSTTQGGSNSGVLAAASPTGHKTSTETAGSSSSPSPSSPSSSSTSSSSTTSSTSSSTTTTNPPPPSTTSTTAPPP